MANMLKKTDKMMFGIFREIEWERVDLALKKGRKYPL